MIHASNDNKSSAQKELEKLREHFKQRAENPPNEALQWSSAWKDYSKEMRDIENQLRELGEDI